MDIVARVKNILTTPKTEWPIIAAEPADLRTLYLGYIVPLSAIPAVCSFLSLSFFANRYGFGLGWAFETALSSYVLGLLGVFLSALVAAKLAPQFGGRDDLVAGLKVIAYGATAAWVGGVFLLIPVLGALAALLCAIYTLYLIFLGLPVLMQTSQSQTGIYAVAILLAVIIIRVVTGVLASSVMAGSYI